MSSMRCKYCGMNTVYDTEFWAVVKEKRAHCWCQNCGAKVVFRLDADDYWLEDDPDVRLPIVAEELRRLRLENERLKAALRQIASIRPAVTSEVSVELRKLQSYIDIAKQALAESEKRS